MRLLLRSLSATLLALLSVIVLAVSWTATTAVQLAATALIMGGTEHPLSTPPDDPITYINPYLSNVVDGFINAAAVAPTGTGLGPIESVGDADRRYAVITPEEFAPLFGSRTFDQSVAVGLDNVSACLTTGPCSYNTNPTLSPPAPATPPVPGEPTDVFGYSQSAVVAALMKRALLADPNHPPVDLSFFLLADPMRPNGGFLSRGPQGLTIPFLGVTFYGPAPTNSCEVGDCMETVDLAAQYDGLGGDAAVGLTNVLAVANAALGYYYLHGDLQNKSFADARYQGSYGDTDYYLVPTPRLPVLMPFEPFVPSPILTALDAPLRAAIEAGYAHDINPGVPVGVSLLPFRNPVQAAVNVLVAIPTGIDDAIAEATHDPTFRPLHTKPVTSPFGVGGPELPPPPASTPSSMSQTTPSDALSTQSVESHTEASTKDDDSITAGARSDKATATTSNARHRKTADPTDSDAPADPHASESDVPASHEFAAPDDDQKATATTGSDKPAKDAPAGAAA
jgi:hypothetical protein